MIKLFPGALQDLVKVRAGMGQLLTLTADDHRLADSQSAALSPLTLRLWLQGLLAFNPPDPH